MHFVIVPRLFVLLLLLHVNVRDKARQKNNKKYILQSYGMDD